MKNGIEIRPNGVKITKVDGENYKVEGLALPYYKLKDARYYADLLKPVTNQENKK